MYFRLSKRAQSTLEYAVLIAAIVGALIAMQIYMKRGIEGRLRSASDDIGEQFDAERTSSEYSTFRTSTTEEETTGGITTTYMGSGSKGSPEVTLRGGSETVEAW